VNIDFGRPFTYLFEDKDWVMKLLMAGLYAIGALFCGIGLFALMGYQKRIAGQVANGQDVPLPEIGFDRIGEDIIEGLKLFLVMIVYLLPSIAIQMCSGVVTNVMASQGGDARDAAAIISLGAICLYFPLQLIGQFLTPVAIIRYIDSGSLGSAFQIGEVIGFTRKQFVNVLLVFVLSIAAQFVASFSLLLLCIGIFWGIAFAMIVNAQAWGQLLRISRQSGAMTAR
jgi:hypothetical protein